MTALDLDAYFERIGYTGARAANLDTLREIHRRHAETITFENLDPMLRRPVRLDISSLQQKLVLDRRGGYCFEQNLLFRHVLEALGFEVTGLAARVMWGVPPETVNPRSHMLLWIQLEGTPYVADVGFGGMTLTGPLRLEADLEQATPHEAFRLTPIDESTRAKIGGEFVLEGKVGASWKPVYRFDRVPQFQPDYEVTSWYLSNHPNSHFMTGLLCARPVAGRRYALRNNELATHHLNGATERRILTSAAELRAALEGPLGISLPDSPELTPLLERLTIPT